MKQTLKLTFIYFKETLFNVMGGLSKKAGRKTLPLLFILFIFISGMIGYSLYNVGQTLKLLNMTKNLLILGLLMAVFISLMINLNDTQGTMYKSKDYDMLMSLPIRSLSIISAKYLSSYLISMLYYFIIALPTFIVFFIYNGFTVLGLIFGLLSILFMPAFSHLISCCISWIVNISTAKVKNKNVIRTIFNLILALGLAIFISFANSNVFDNMFNNGLPLWFKIILSNIYFLFTAVTLNSPLYFLACLGVNIAFMALGIVIISLGFKKINSALLSTKIKRSTKTLTYNAKKPFANLYKKEITTFFNSPVYCVNGLIGNIMTIAVTIISVTTFNQIKTFEFALPIITIIEVFGLAMCIGIAPTTSASISMEGTKLQTLKSLPVKFKDIVLSKMALNITLSFPIVTICAVIFSAIIKSGLLLATIILVYLWLALLSQTMLGLILNLRFPRLNWTNETQATKGGMSFILTMALDIFISILPMVIYLVLIEELQKISLEVYLAIIIAFEVIITLTLIIILIKKGKKLFNNIAV